MSPKTIKPKITKHFYGSNLKCLLKCKGQLSRLKKSIFFKFLVDQKCLQLKGLDYAHVSILINTYSSYHDDYLVNNNLVANTINSLSLTVDRDVYYEEKKDIYCTKMCYFLHLLLWSISKVVIIKGSKHFLKLLLLAECFLGAKPQNTVYVFA